MVTLHIDDDDLKMQIRDFGKQCDSSQIKPDGLGTHCTNEIMDNFSYCTERVKGILLTMVRQLKANYISLGERKRMSIELELGRSAERYSAKTH